MPRLANIAALTALSLSVLMPCLAGASGKTSAEKWREQETWIQFTEKESHGGFKLSGQHLPLKASSPGPAAAAPFWLIQGTGAPTEPVSSSGNFSVPYWIAVEQKDAPVYGTNKVETEMVPLVSGHQISGWGPWGYHSFWGAGTYGSPPFSHVPVWTSPLGAVGAMGQRLNWGIRTRTIQTGPSKPSGNYYSPATADPSASGNYYAGSGPKATTILPSQGQPAPKDYWGQGGSPLPEDFQPK